MRQFRREAGVLASRKLLIIGLDAATFHLLKPWAEEGRLPNLARFLSDGAWGILHSTLPPCSPPAWCSFATGMNPGQHGVLGFHQFLPHAYEPYLMNGSSRRGATFWEVAGQHGIRGGILNLPFTFPPRPFNGFMVSGMLTPRMGPRMASPPEVYHDLIEASPDYAVDVDMSGSFGSRPDVFLDQVLASLRARVAAAVGLYRKHRPDLFCVVFVAADRACHYLWSYMEAARDGRPLTPSQQRLADGIRQVYEQLDAAVGTLLDEAGEETDVLVMSDHGACAVRRGLSLRNALAEAGLLAARPVSTGRRLKKRLVLSLGRRMPHAVRKMLVSRLPRLARRASAAVACEDIDFARTRAYPTGLTQGVFVNLKGRQPFGTVEPGEEYEAVRDSVIEALCSIRDPQTGRPAVRKVHRREELWSGQCLEQLPDLIVEPIDDSYTIRTFVTQETDGVFYELDEPSWTSIVQIGNHHREGILMAMGPHVKKALIRQAHIVDVPATVLALLGCPIPENFEGRVLTEMLTDDVRVPNREAAAADGPAETTAEMPEEDRAAVEKRLDALGYM